MFECNKTRPRDTERKLANVLSNYSVDCIVSMFSPMGMRVGGTKYITIIKDTDGACFRLVECGLMDPLCDM